MLAGLAGMTLFACADAEPNLGPADQATQTAGSRSAGLAGGAGASAGASPLPTAAAGHAGAANGGSTARAGAAAGVSGSAAFTGAAAGVGDAVSGSAAAGAAGLAAGAAGAAGLAAGASGVGGVSGDALGAAGTAGAPALTDLTIWIAGDSTVAKGNTPCPVGWGVDFGTHFSDQVKVVNSAVGGRSVRTWLYDVGTTMDAAGECVLMKDASGAPVVQARWQQMLDGMSAGDYLFIQFGINDSSATCDRHVGLAAFKESYGMMAMAAKAHGTQPIFLTPVSSISCQGSTARGTRGAFVTATQEAGQQYDVPVIDLHALSVKLYTSLGLCPLPGGSDVSASTGGDVGAFFCDDHTHFERSGAAEIGKLIVQALRDKHIGLAAYLK
jgi:lysophospholipase L1-like esterase